MRFSVSLHWAFLKEVWNAGSNIDLALKCCLKREHSRTLQILLLKFSIVVYVNWFFLTSDKIRVLWNILRNISQASSVLYASPVSLVLWVGVLRELDLYTYTFLWSVVPLFFVFALFSFVFKMDFHIARLASFEFTM